MVEKDKRFVLSAFDLSALEASAHVEPDSSASLQHEGRVVVSSETAEMLEILSNAFCSIRTEEI